MADPPRAVDLKPTGAAARVGLLGTSAVATIAVLLAPPGASPDVVAPRLAVALLAMAALVALEHRRPTLSSRSVLSVGCVLAAAAVIRPALGSHDLWSYAMYGRILAFHHANPYVHQPAAYALDPFLHSVSPAWRHSTSIYGPGFVLFAAALTKLAAGSILATRIAFQASAAVTLLLIGVLLVRVRAPGWAVAVVVVNPLVIVYAVNGGHNDVLVGGALLAAALALDRQQFVVGGLGLAAATSIKLVAGLSAAAAVVWIYRRYGRRAAAMVGISASVPVGAGYLAFGGARALRPLLNGEKWTSRASMWSLLKHVPLLHGHVGVVALSAVLIVTACLVAPNRESGSAASPIAAGVVGYLIAGAYVLPWYLMWALPVAALSKSTRLVRLVLAYSSGLALAYVYRPGKHLDDLDLLLHACVAVTEVAVLVVSASIIVSAVIRWRRTGRVAVSTTH